MTSAGADTFAWDAENRLVASKTGGTPATYAYNGDGLRTSRTVGGNGISYIWDLTAALPVILQDSEGNRYVYGLDLLTRINGATEEWNLYDGLGSTTEVTDAAGAVTGSYQYDVFGAVRAQIGATTEWSHTGEQNDPTGLEYLRARYYDPGSGRFLSEDPLMATPASTGHRYSYGGLSPVNVIDPSGLEPDDPTPVAAISKQERHRRCLAGFEECESMLVGEARAKWGAREPYPGYFSSVCAFMLLRCEQQSPDGTFDNELARRQMGLTDNGEPWWSKLFDIPLRGLNAIGLPSTGSGGYLNSERDKEGGAFGCPAWPSLKSSRGN